MNLLAIDPGTEKSGYVIFNGTEVLHAGVVPNELMIQHVACLANRVAGYEITFPVHHLAIEMVAAMGMAVGAEVFETVRWIGRFQDRWETVDCRDPISLIYRQQVKLHLCGSARAKDPNVRQALVDRFGKPGTKKNPGLLYGVSSHAWAALAVAVYWWDVQR